MWQDKVIAAVSSLFGILLLPQLYDTIYNGSTMSPITAYSTAAGLCVMAICYSSMKMKFATVTSLISASVWFLLGFFG
jgi:hypothetical protein